MVDMVVRSKLAEILDSRGMKQKFLSDKTGLGRNTVSEMVKGFSPSLGSALKVANVLGLTVDEIWYLEELTQEEPTPE